MHCNIHYPYCDRLYVPMCVSNMLTLSRLWTRTKRRFDTTSLKVSVFWDAHFDQQCCVAVVRIRLHVEKGRAETWEL